MNLKRLKRIAKKNVIKISPLATTGTEPCDRCGCDLLPMVFFRETIFKVPPKANQYFEKVFCRWECNECASKYEYV
jgi:hypothetical protein